MRHPSRLQQRPHWPGSPDASAGTANRADVPAMSLGSRIPLPPPRRTASGPAPGSLSYKDAFPAPPRDTRPGPPRRTRLAAAAPHGSPRLDLSLLSAPARPCTRRARVRARAGARNLRRAGCRCGHDRRLHHGQRVSPLVFVVIVGARARGSPEDEEGRVTRGDALVRREDGGLTTMTRPRADRT